MVTLMSQENMVALVSRTGRHLQRYRKGRRQVVGCIPYRYKIAKQTSLVEAGELEVLVISSQKGKGMLFPKGGWEKDESIKEAALRETLEEAGVRGVIQRELGKWNFKSKTHDTYYEGYMFPLLVEEQLDFWPEKDVRQRKWMNVQEAREVCQYLWMKEALDKLVNRLTTQQHVDEEQHTAMPALRPDEVNRGKVGSKQTRMIDDVGKVIIEVGILVLLVFVCWNSMTQNHRKQSDIR